MTTRIRNLEQGIQLCWWIILAVVIAVVVFIRIHLLAIPLERDEGEYAYAGQLMLEGIPPYQLAYNMKFPGVYAAYALIMWIFGQTSTGIHLGLLIVNIANITLVFLIGRRLTGLIAGLAAAASYAILSASSSVLGLAAHATHFVMLPTLLGALVLLKPVLTKKMVFVSESLSAVITLFHPKSCLWSRKTAIAAFPAHSAMICLLRIVAKKRSDEALVAEVLAAASPRLYTCEMARSNPPYYLTRKTR